MSWTSGYQRVWVLFVWFLVLRNITVNAEQNCKTLGPYEHPTDCTKFYMCTDLGPVLQHCPPWLHFNPELRVCDWSARSGCTHKTYDETNCPIYPHPTDCTKFYLCAPNEHILMSCPVDLHFNSKIKVCDWPDNAECVSTEESQNEYNYSYSSTTETHQETSEAFPDEHEEPTSTIKEEITSTQDPESSTLNQGYESYTVTDGESPSTAFITSVIPEESTFNAEYELSTTTQDSNITESSTLNQNYESAESTFHASITSSDSTDFYSSTSSSSNTTESLTKTTDYASNFTAPNTSPASFNFNSTNGCSINLWPHPSDCKKFYMASPVGNVELVCPNNLLFNPMLLICDLPSNVDCEIFISTESSAQSTNQEYTTITVDADRQETATNLDNSVATSTLINNESTISTNAPFLTTITENNNQNNTDVINTDVSTSEIRETTTDFGLNIEVSATATENIYETTFDGDKIETSASTLIDNIHEITTDYEGIIIEADDPGSTTADEIWETALPNEFFYKPCKGPIWPHPVDCKKFFRCSSLGSTEMSCSEPLLFNPVLLVCDWPNNVDCEENTDKQDTAMKKFTEADLRTTEDLNETIAAVNDFEAFNTESNSFVDTDYQELIINSTEFTVTEHIRPQICNGTIWPHPSDCTKFYKCDSTGPIMRLCPDDLLFNPNILVCDWPENVECTQSTMISAKSSKRIDDNSILGLQKYRL